MIFNHHGDDVNSKKTRFKKKKPNTVELFFFLVCGNDNNKF